MAGQPRRRARELRELARMEEEGNPIVANALESLGVDPDTAADQAQLDEAARGTATTEIPSVSPEAAPPEEPNPFEVAAAQGVTATEPAPTSRLLNRIAPAPVPPPRISPQESKLQARLVKEAARTASPSTQRLGPLGRKLPGAEHLKVHKRDILSGKLSYVGSYSMKDLSQSEDAESFIASYIKPKYGPGEYQITGVDAQGRQMDAGTVAILDPIGDGIPSIAGMGNKNVIDLIDKLLNERAKPNQNPMKDPIEQIKGLHELQRDLTSGSNKESQSALAAAITAAQASSASAMELVMNIMKDKNGPDPMMLMLLKMMLEQKEAPAAALPPPPAPRSSFFEGVTLRDVLEAIPAIAGVVAVLRPKDDSKEWMREMLLKRPEEHFGIKDALELFKSSQQQQSQSTDLRKSLEDLNALFGVVNMVKQQTEGGGGAGWADAIGALFSNPGIGNSIATLIRNKTGQAPRALAAANTSDIEAAELERKAAEVRQQRIDIAKRRYAAEQEALSREQQGDPAAHRPRITGVPAAAQVPASVLPQAQQATPQGPQTPAQAAEAAAKRVEARTGQKQPPLPEGFADVFNTNIVMAEDEAALVEGALNTIVYLRDFEEWKKFPEGIFQLVANGDKPRTLGYLNAFFEGLFAVGMMSEELFKRLMTAIDAHFDEISGMVQEHLNGENSDEVSDGEDSDNSEEAEDTTPATDTSS